MSSRRALPFTLAAFVGLIGLTACGDARVRNLSRGIARDSVLKLIGAEGARGDTIPNVQRVARYITGGQNLEILYFNPEPEAERADSVDRVQTIPLVLVDGKLSGWGWDFWDSTATAHRIPGNASKR